MRSKNKELMTKMLNFKCIKLDGFGYSGCLMILFYSFYRF